MCSKPDQNLQLASDGLNHPWLPPGCGSLPPRGLDGCTGDELPASRWLLAVARICSRVFGPASLAISRLHKYKSQKIHLEHHPTRASGFLNI